MKLVWDAVSKMPVTKSNTVELDEVETMKQAHAERWVMLTQDIGSNVDAITLVDALIRTGNLEEAHAVQERWLATPAGGKFRWEPLYLRKQEKRDKQIEVAMIVVAVAVVLALWWVL